MYKTTSCVSRYELRYYSLALLQRTSVVIDHSEITSSVYYFTVSSETEPIVHLN